MYSLLPALVSGLFLAYGSYVLLAKGLNRTTGSFFLLCMTTFIWQGTWAVLFTAESAATADQMIAFGYMLIAFLPSTLYHFLTEISEQKKELRWVGLSYLFSTVFAILSLKTQYVVAGHYHHSWGYYPQAGSLHWLHVVQTALVVSRGLMITWQQERVAQGAQKLRLRLCIYSIVIYFFAAVDYLCNYGLDFYPPGVIFIAAALGIMGYATLRHDLMSKFEAAATIAHELRTPLATIRMQAGHAAQQLPQMLKELQEARTFQSSFGTNQPQESESAIEAHQRLEVMCQKIIQQVDRTNQMIDLILASARMEHIDQQQFKWLSMQYCVEQALENYPFHGNQQNKVHFNCEQDFDFFGSESLLIFALSNLIKNSLYAMKVADKGEIYITLKATKQASHFNILTITDTGSGIPKSVLPHIFDTYYSTKESAGAGVGLAFCLRVAKAFGGQLRCESVQGEYTTFELCLPQRKDALLSQDAEFLISAT